MIFGGKNLLNYCKASISIFTTDKAKIEKNLQRIKDKFDENRTEMKKYKFI